MNKQEFDAYIKQAKWNCHYGGKPTKIYKAVYNHLVLGMTQYKASKQAGYYNQRALNRKLAQLKKANKK